MAGHWLSDVHGSPTRNWDEPEAPVSAPPSTTTHVSRGLLTVNGPEVGAMYGGQLAHDPYVDQAKVTSAE
ncbi:MAG: hypothetical protein ACRENE_11385 [Polyangiaceae bacterium]